MYVSVPFGFSVVGQDKAQEKITFQAGSQEEKASWMEELNAALAKPEALRGHTSCSSSAGVGMLLPSHTHSPTTESSLPPAEKFSRSKHDLPPS